jgi:hypothetical protein
MTTEAAMARPYILSVVIPFALLGCVAGHLPTGTVRDPNLITEDEIVASHTATAYDAIHKLRANFLHQRGLTSFYNTSSPLPTIYVDGQRYGELPILRTISSEVVSSIRLYRAWEATTRYGMNNMGGVIAITTRQGFDQSATGPSDAP